MANKKKKANTLLGGATSLLVGLLGTSLCGARLCGTRLFGGRLLGHGLLDGRLLGHGLLGGRLLDRSLFGVLLLPLDLFLGALSHGLFLLCGHLDLFLLTLGLALLDDGLAVLGAAQLALV